MPTGQLDVRDAVVDLDANRQSIDVGHWVAARLQHDWDPTNTGFEGQGRTPEVNLHEDTKSYDFLRGSDYITVYEVDRPDDAVPTTGWSFSNQTIRVTCETYSAVSRQHSLRMVEEVRRILLSHRNDPFDDLSHSLPGRFWWSSLEGWAPQDQTSKNHWRTILDFQLNWRFREVKT